MISFLPRLFFRTALLTAVLELILCSLARAACPHPTPAPNSEFFKASVVVTGTVISEEVDLNPYDTSLIEGWLYHLRIERTLRGSPQEFITVYTENDNGRFPLKVGERYLLFVFRREDRMEIDGCGNSALLSEAGGAVRAIEEIKNAGPYGEIEGRVELGRGGDGVRGIRIVARNARFRFSTVSGQDGWFQMRVPPGKYKLSARSRKFSLEFSEATLWYDDPDNFVVHRGSTSYFEYLASPR
jgi:hypothetical protein